MRFARATMLLFSASLAAAGPAVAQIPAHPEKIEFPPLQFEPPVAAEYRHELPGGVPVYLAPSREFPLINIVFTFRGGTYLDPADQIGLASVTAEMIRRGGTASMSPSALDEEFDFLAANVSVNGGETQCSASLNCLASNFDQAFHLFLQLLREPGFDADRLQIVRHGLLESMKQRNDSADAILARQWNWLLYGMDHFEAAVPTAAMIEAIDPDMLREMHSRIFHPGNLLIAVTGDFDEQVMPKKLTEALQGWSAGPVSPRPHAPQEKIEPGVYHVEKDVPQGKIAIGKRSIMRDDPDYFAAMIMNDILGGGAFTSRITNRVRSDEGLAYSAGSGLSGGPYYPGQFRARADSKSATVALAIKIILEEVAAIRSELVTDEELQTAKNALIERFPRAFESRPAMLSIFVDDEITGRPADYWQTYRDKVRAVTAADVQRIAKRLLDPQSMAILVVGRWSEIAPGDLEGRASMADFYSGNVSHLPLRDPLTLDPLPTQSP